MLENANIASRLDIEQQRTRKQIQQQITLENQKRILEKQAMLKAQVIGITDC